MTSAEAQENLATIQAQEVIAKSASDLSFAQQFVGTASLAQVQSGEGQLLQNVEKFSQEKALFDAREAANAAPVSGDDSVKLVEDTSFTFSVLDNDKRADGDDLERATLYRSVHLQMVLLKSFHKKMKLIFPKFLCLGAIEFD